MLPKTPEDVCLQRELFEADQGEKVSVPNALIVSSATAAMTPETPAKWSSVSSGFRKGGPKNDCKYR